MANRIKAFFHLQISTYKLATFLGQQIFLNTERHFNIDPSGTKTGIFEEDSANNMSADALVPCLARPLASMVPTILDTLVMTFHEDGFPITCATSMLRNDRKCKYYFCFLWEIQRVKGQMTQEGIQVQHIYLEMSVSLKQDQNQGSQ